MWRVGAVEFQHAMVLREMMLEAFHRRTPYVSVDPASIADRSGHT